RSAVTQDCLARRCRAMTPPCVVPTFRPYTVENLEFGGFDASSCESRVWRLRSPHLGQHGFRRDATVHYPSAPGFAILDLDPPEEVAQRRLVRGIARHHLVSQRETLWGHDQGHDHLDAV